MDGVRPVLVVRGWRATREHCFKECITWWKEIGTLGKRVGQTGEKRARGGCERVYRKGKGFGYGDRARQYHRKDEWCSGLYI